MILHAMFRLWRAGWACEACGFEVFADDLASVVRHVVQNQVVIRG